MPSTSNSISLPTNVSSGLFSARVCSHTVDYSETVSLQPLPFQVSAHPPRNGTMDSSFCFLMTGGGSAVVTEATGEVTTTLGGNPSHHLSMHSVVWLSYWNYHVKQFPKPSPTQAFPQRALAGRMRRNGLGVWGMQQECQGTPKHGHRRFRQVRSVPEVGASSTHSRSIIQPLRGRPRSQIQARKCDPL